MKIEVNKWLTSEMDGVLFDGKRYCCLGFLAKHLGLSDEEMLGKGSLSECYYKLPANLEWLEKPAKWIDKQEFKRTETLIQYLNDSPKFTLAQRKANLNKLFSAVKVKIEWI